MGRMVEVKVSELVGQALNWAVAKVEGLTLHTMSRHWLTGLPYLCADWMENDLPEWTPSTDWAQGGPLIDKYRPDVQTTPTGTLAAYLNNSLDDVDPLITGVGDTYLVAACRAIVAARFGAIVSVPAELLENA